MDTSEQYIKMCEKAVEIQKQWPLGAIYNGKNQIVLGLAYLQNHVLFQDATKYIWLPRQDQLQEMVDCHSFTVTQRHKPWRMYAHLNIYFGESMEQLWLAFVMHEKYNKVWNGEDWIEEG